MIKNTVKSNVFLIFDNSFFLSEDFGSLYRHIELFPLTADWRDIDAVIDFLKRLNIEINMLNSARIIEDQALLYRDKFIDWAGRISSFSIDNKPIREWFLLSDNGVSAWWFGLLADKDTIKSQVFLKIVRTAAILSQIKNCNSHAVILALKNSTYRRQLKVILADLKINCQVIQTKTSWKGFLKITNNFLKKINTIRAFHIFVVTLLRSTYLKIQMPPLRKRKMLFSNALLFFTYFPSFLKSQVQQDKFSNKFADPLQELCEINKKDIIWVANYTEFEDYSFNDAVHMARRFIRNGEFLFFWLEFLSFKDIFPMLLQYFRLASVHRYLKKKLTYKLINQMTGCDFSGLFFLETLEQSFYGGYYLNGIIQYVAFKNMLRKLNGFSHAVYTCEMMGWEYAFNAAKRKEEKKFPVIGYQDFSFSPNLLQMFHSKEELEFKNSSFGIPMPEIIASCGRIPQVMLEKYYGNIHNLETLRFAYLTKFMQLKESLQKRKKGNRFILLVCTNIDMNESKGMVSLIDAACKNIKKEVEVWFKGHPALPIQKVFNELGLIFNNYSYTFKIGNVSESLIECDAVLVREGSVAIEALAFGCEVLVYLSPGMLNLSSLFGFEEFYWKIYNPDTLLEVINNIRSGYQRQSIEKKQDFVKEYWNLNPNLDRWKQLLNLN